MNEDTLKSAKKFLYIMAIYFIIVIYTYIIQKLFVANFFDFCYNT